ncbi:eCIS core domain-containing protein [Pseudomonas fluorescens]|uniref:eCIS core domain-containing protein n=1 Tax=Pseudomonas fluorescens TaxID=294 RepID=UPI0030CC0EEC
MQGVLGDAINLVAPGTGTSLDDAHRQLKENIEPYKQLEEGASNTVRESLVQASAPILQEMISRSRDDAISAGVEPIPLNIRKNLHGFIPDSILNMAKFRVQGGGDLSLQVNSIRYGDAQAITLDYVIVFKDTNGALYNPSLWAHEFTHVIQYQDWGLAEPSAPSYPVMAGNFSQ